MVFVGEGDRQRIEDKTGERNLTVLVNESSVPKLRALTSEHLLIITDA